MSEPRYRPIQRLEAGGMAEVYVAEAQSLQGFKKKVAIKRVLPHLAQNKNFIGMFLDEARLGAKLTHANIVSVLDIGAADNTFFIVMEFVDGCNLKKVIETLRKHGRPFPVKEAIYLAMEALRGLSFAHDVTDEDGELLHIVHRDVSPPNILISKRGEVKVTDFGLAKATTQLEKTDPGVVKGKFSYLAPEAAIGQPVDARADVFAMGIVLWEMLAGRRLFLGENDFQTVKLVQQANVPSISRVNPEVDLEFEQVLNRALTRDPADRYQSAREFADALTGYLFSHKLKVTSYDVANLVKSTLADEGEQVKGPAQQSIIDKLIQEELLRFTSIDSDETEADSDLLSPERADEGSRPLDLGGFENPASWFDDDELGGGGLEAALEGDGKSRWHESGIDDTSKHSTGKASAGTAPAGQPAPRAGAATRAAPPLAPPAAPLPPPAAVSHVSAAGSLPVAPPPPNDTPAKSGRGALFAVVAVIALVGGAAAYFLTHAH